MTAAPGEGAQFDVSAADFFQVKEDTSVIRHDLKSVQTSLQLQNALITKLVDRLTDLEVRFARHEEKPGHVRTLEVQRETRKEIEHIKGEVSSIRQYIARAGGAVAAVVILMNVVSKYIPSP